MQFSFIKSLKLFNSVYILYFSIYNYYISIELSYFKLILWFELFELISKVPLISLNGLKK